MDKLIEVKQRTGDARTRLGGSSGGGVVRHVVLCNVRLASARPDIH